MNMGRKSKSFGRILFIKDENFKNVDKIETFGSAFANTEGKIRGEKVVKTEKKTETWKKGHDK